MTSGRGMGLAIVSEKIKDLAGSMKINSKPNIGTKIILNVPFTRAILKAQLITIGGDLFAIPLENIKQIYYFDRKLVEYVKGDEFYRIKSKLVPIIKLSSYFGLNHAGSTNKADSADAKAKIAIWCQKDDKNSAILIADGINQQMEIVVKPFRSKFSHLKGISGVTITGDGSICLILDILDMLTLKIQDTQEVLVAESVQES